MIANRTRVTGKQGNDNQNYGFSLLQNQSTLPPLTYWTF